jgi:hypothetical protein
MRHQVKLGFLSLGLLVGLSCVAALLYWLAVRDRVSISVPQADCSVVCDRTFLRCAAETLIVAGKLPRSEIQRLKKSGLMERVSNSGFVQCLAECRELDDNRTDIAIPCLAAPDCWSYAECVDSLLEEK